MISVVILAAGASKRMGKPKMLLPWGNGTVIEQVVSVFQKSGLEDIVVVTGGAREQVESLIAGFNARTIYNKDFSNDDMLSSLQCGMRALKSQAEAMLIALGDQPQVQEGSVRRVCEEFIETRSSLVVPSYRMRRGHPWLVTRPLWDELLEMNPPQSLRDFLKSHADEIQYVNVDDPNILADLDTPEDYAKWRAKDS